MPGRLKTPAPRLRVARASGNPIPLTAIRDYDRHMPTRPICNDLHYNGRTVEERLALDGLSEQFRTATADRDIPKMVMLLEQVQITNAWAGKLTKMILDEPPQFPIRLAVEDPRNAGVLGRVNELKFPACLRPVEIPRDPYWHLGSHPDVVEYVWNELGGKLPEDCRCIVYGSPGLVAPRSGVLLAQSFGTQYILRVPHDAMPEALRAGAKTQMTWSNKSVTDLTREYGGDWVFGNYADRLRDWLLEVHNAVEHAGRS